MGSRDSETLLHDSVFLISHMPMALFSRELALLVGGACAFFAEISPSRFTWCLTHG